MLQSLRLDPDPPPGDLIDKGRIEQRGAPRLAFQPLRRGPYHLYIHLSYTCYFRNPG
jgi:hypothetical protein